MWASGEEFRTDVDILLKVQWPGNVFSIMLGACEVRGRPQRGNIRNERTRQILRGTGPKPELNQRKCKWEGGRRSCQGI